MSTLVSILLAVVMELLSPSTEKISATVSCIPEINQGIEIHMVAEVGPTSNQFKNC